MLCSLQISKVLSIWNTQRIGTFNPYVQAAALSRAEKRKGDRYPGWTALIDIAGRCWKMLLTNVYNLY